MYIPIHFNARDKLSHGVENEITTCAQRQRLYMYNNSSMCVFSNVQLKQIDMPSPLFSKFLPQKRMHAKCQETHDCQN